MKKKIAVIVMAIAVAVNMTACLPLVLTAARDAKRDIEAGITPAVTVEPTEIPTPEPPINPGGSEETGSSVDSGSEAGSKNSYLDYEHYDSEKFLSMCDGFAAMANGADPEDICAYYDGLYAEYLHLYDLNTAISILHEGDITDDYYTEEEEYMSAAFVECDNAFATACHEVINGDMGQEFMDHLDNEDVASYYYYYEDLDEETMELINTQNSLVNDYYRIINDYESVEYIYKGKAYTFADDLNALYEKDPEGYVEVYYGILEEINKLVGPIYVELIQIRTEIAKAYGYDDYIGYMDDGGYGRDYSSDQLEKLYSIAKELGNGGANDYIDYVIYQKVGEGMSIGVMLDTLGKYAEQISPLAGEAYEVFVENELYDIDSNEGRINANFTSEFYIDPAPFIFMNMTYTDSDFQTLSHEFGHFVNRYNDPDPAPQCSVGNYDVFEVHSNGLELLFTKYYDEIYGGDADFMTAYAIADQLDSVIVGCYYDEWQREIYSNPDMTLDEINRKFAEIKEEYGVYEAQDVDYTWMFVTHNFDAPLYYISYAVSATAAIQIWDLSQSDYQAAVEVWENFIPCSGFDGRGYMEIAKDCGLEPFTDGDNAKEACEDAFGKLREMVQGKP